MKSSAGYLTPRTSAKDLRTSLQIQIQNPGSISKSSAESFRCVVGYLKFRYQTGCSNQPRHYPPKKKVTEKIKISFCVF